MNADPFQAGGEAYRRGDYRAAEQFYRLAVGQAPSNPDARLNLGILLRTIGQPQAARAQLAAGLALAPERGDLQWALGLTLLTLGDYAAGWPLYEKRREIFKVATPNLPVPEWKGEPPAGKRIAVFHEQGLGDAIQFARFLPTLRAQGAEVVLLCKPALQPLFANAFADIEVQALAGQIVLGEIDYWVSILSLAYRLGATLETLPAGPYLRAADPAPHQDGVFRVGLMTKGNAAHENDARRSLSPEQADRLAQLPGVETVSLQPEHAGDFSQTANLIAGLDLVISVDTSIGHLAGALGKPVFLLVPGLGADWRWMIERTDSPWYPHHRLFRAGADSDWTPALDQIATAVAERAASTLTLGPSAHT